MRQGDGATGVRRSLVIAWKGDFHDPPQTPANHRAQGQAQFPHPDRGRLGPIRRWQVDWKLHDEGPNTFIEAACNPVHVNQVLNNLLIDRFGPKF